MPSQELITEKLIKMKEYQSNSRAIYTLFKRDKPICQPAEIQMKA
jgi:hypothetical protein